MELPKLEEIKTFSEIAKASIKNLKFNEKQAIVRNTIDKIVGTKSELLIHGYIPVTSNINVFTIHWNCRITQRWKINVV